MGQSLSRIYIHLIFSTKNRKAHFRDLEIREQVFKYLAGGIRGMECTPIIVGGFEDHVHSLFELTRTRDMADFTMELKRESSKWIKQKFPACRGFQWQVGYGAFSVSHSSVDRVKRYIADQAKHHLNVSFQTEYRRTLENHGLAWDEKYVWD